MHRPITPRRFRFLERISDGDYGAIYRVEQLVDGQPEIVALKWLQAAWPSGIKLADARAQILSLRQMTHPNIAQLFDLVCIDGKCALVREYLEGVDLWWVFIVLRHRRQEFPRAVLFEIIGTVASALEEAHTNSPRPVIHNDLKPSNLFLTSDGTIKVLDFAPEAIYGQPGPFEKGSPECLYGDQLSPEGDIFLLGVILYEMLALEDFGRIDPRSRKFAERLEVRLAKIPLRQDHPQSLFVHDNVRQILRQMLSYELTERPKAREVAVIMDQLAREARGIDPSSDVRTLVAWATQAMPPTDGDDPLCGMIIDADGALYVTPAEHAPLLANIVSAPGDDTVRLVYADWLEERQDGRAAILRAQVRGKLPRFNTGLKLDPAWIARVDRTPIKNCRHAQCPGAWEQLAAGDDPLVRSCGSCLREVYHCATHEEAKLRSEWDEPFALSAFAATSDPPRLHPLPRGQMSHSNSVANPLWKSPRRLPTPLEPSSPAFVEPLLVEVEPAADLAPTLPATPSVTDIPTATPQSWWKRWWWR